MVYNSNMKTEISVVNLFILFLFVVRGHGENATFNVCGDDNHELVIQNINNTVDRLMILRHPTWGWTNTPEVVLGLQLSAQDNFFGRSESLKQMKKEIIAEFHTMSIGKLAQYVLAIQSLCEDPRNIDGRNLVKHLEKRIGEEKIPHENYYSFALALGAVCVNNGSVKILTVRNLWREQNEDGSFGDRPSLDDAAQLLLALRCIKSGTRPRFLMRRVKQSIDKLVMFLKSKVVDVGQDTFIGNKFSTPSSALALGDADDGSSEKWNCSDVMQSLVKPSDVVATEGALSQRIPALAGNSYLKLKSEWKCISEVPVPVGYLPSCEPADPSTCFPATKYSAPINFRLKIFTDIPPIVSENPKTDISLVVRNGTTLHQAMIDARNDGLITFETVSYSFGESVTSLQGVIADPNARQYWALVNGRTGEFLPVGISAYIPKDGDAITFKLQTY